MDFHSECDGLHEDYLRECRFVKNLSPRTILSYRHCYRCLRPFLDTADWDWQRSIMLLAETDRRNAGGINIIVRSMKAFLHWLAENEKISSCPRLKKQKEPKVATAVLSDAQVEDIIHFKPAGAGMRRTQILALTILDCGFRIDEALKIRLPQIDFENNLIQVRGKGSRDRVVPMSTDLKKKLHGYLKSHGSGVAFPAFQGQREFLAYRTADFDLKDFGRALEIPGLHFHKLRHTMATHYIRQGGDIVRLQRILGHSTITTTMRYVHIQTEDLSRVHEQFSILAKSGR